MNGSKVLAIAAGAISVVLALAYLILVQLLDLRGEMIPITDDSLIIPVWQGLIMR